MKGLNISKLDTKKSKIISTEEVLSDIVPFDWSDDNIDELIELELNNTGIDEFLEKFKK